MTRHKPDAANVQNYVVSRCRSSKVTFLTYVRLVCILVTQLLTMVPLMTAEFFALTRRPVLLCH